MVVERLGERVAEIAAKLKIVFDCEWFGFWHEGMQERLACPDLDLVDVVLWMLKGLSRLADDVVILNRQVVRLETQTILTGQAVQPASPVIVPEREIRVTSPTQRTILYVMGKTGIGRRWRLASQVVESANASEGTIRNAFASLAKHGLIAPYRYQGKPAWYTRGKGRHKLYVLADDGRSWYEHNYGEVATSELEDMVPRHRGVQHAVDILEVRDLMRDLGLRVDDHPAPLLATGDEWGPRAEPDLVVQYGGHSWPVEVQREVRVRNDGKWEKVLALSEGRLMLILETRVKQQNQTRILCDAALHLPAGKILVGSLEGLHAEEDWPRDWDEIITGKR